MYNLDNVISPCFMSFRHRKQVQSGTMTMLKNANKLEFQSVPTIIFRTAYKIRLPEWGFIGPINYIGTALILIEPFSVLFSTNFLTFPTNKFYAVGSFGLY